MKLNAPSINIVSHPMTRGVSVNITSPEKKINTGHSEDLRCEANLKYKDDPKIKTTSKMNTK